MVCCIIKHFFAEGLYFGHASRNGNNSITLCLSKPHSLFHVFHDIKNIPSYFPSKKTYNDKNTYLGQIRWSLSSGQIDHNEVHGNPLYTCKGRRMFNISVQKYKWSGCHQYFRLEDVLILLDKVKGICCMDLYFKQILFYSRFNEYIKQHTCFHIANHRKCFSVLNHYISVISEGSFDTEN